MLKTRQDISLLVGLRVKYERCIRKVKAPYSKFGKDGYGDGYSFAGVPKEEVPYILGNFMKLSGIRNAGLAAAILLHDSLTKYDDYSWRPPAEIELAKLVTPALAAELLAAKPLCHSVENILKSKLTPAGRLLAEAVSVLSSSAFFEKLHRDGQELMNGEDGI